MHNLRPKTLFIGQEIVYLPVCESTNDYAVQLLNSNPPAEGCIVITSQQTKGRGQRGNAWEAEADQNLTFSVILHPHFLNPSDQFRLNVAVSLAVSDLLATELGGQLKIKWPNDIYVQDRKIGGILIENQLQNNRIRYSVVGIGLNINQLNFGENKAVSLAQLKNKSYQLSGLLEQLLEKFEGRYLQLRNQSFAAMRADYLQRLYWYQEIHTFRLAENEQPFEGQIIGIDEIGRLAVADQQTIRYFNLKEIVFMR
jgi:BirA family transcriptional regulator, biotin operon repressor / biotin---[acetyl-CoA-carboxylase] ligase